MGDLMMEEEGEAGTQFLLSNKAFTVPNQENKHSHSHLCANSQHKPVVFRIKAGNKAPHSVNTC